MSESNDPPFTACPIDCPPPAPQPVRAEPDPRARLRQLALELVRTHNRALIVEYLRLRREVQ